jgi:hypothetical protein
LRAGEAAVAEPAIPVPGIPGIGEESLDGGKKCLGALLGMGLIDALRGRSSGLVHVAEAETEAEVEALVGVK